MSCTCDTAGECQAHKNEKSSFNAGLKAGAERERQRLISRLVAGLLHPNLTLSKKDEIELYINWLNGGGK